MSDRPMLRIVRGEPSPEELAVLTALVTAAGGDEPEATPAARGGWSDPTWRMRATHLHGPGAWRAAARS